MNLPTSTPHLFRMLLTGFTLGMLSVPSVHAANQSWDGSEGSAWEDPANWAGNAVPGATTGSTNFDVATVATANVTTVAVDAGRRLAGMTFGGAGGNYTVTGSLLINSTGFGDSIKSNTSNSSTINFNATLTANTTGVFGFYNNTNSAASILLGQGNIFGFTSGSSIFGLGGNNTTFGASVISGNISNGTGSNVLTLTKSDGGNWIVSGNNTHTGGTLIRGGTLRTNNASALGTGVVTLNSIATARLDLNGTALTIAGLNSGVSTNAAAAGANGFVSVGSGGTGYTAGTTTVTITGGGGSGATATASVSGGAVTAINITNYGTGYTSTPTFTVNSTGGGTGATVNATGFAASNVILGTGTLTINGTGVTPLLYSGAITGTGGNLVKAGTNTQVLVGASTYTGLTTIQGGALIIGAGGGTGSLTSAISVEQGTLGGTGSTTGAVNVGDSLAGAAFLAAGYNGVGTFTTTAALTLHSDATMVYELNSDTSTADLLVANGVTINAASLFSITDLGTTVLAANVQFTVINNTSASLITGNFANLIHGTEFTAGLNTFSVNYFGGTGNDLVLTTVPEPTTAATLLLGAFAITLRRRRR